LSAVLTQTRTPVLHFAGGLAGFPDTEAYTLREVEGASPLFLLTSVDEDGPEFVVVPPSAFFPDYAPVLDDESCARLALTDAEDAVLLVVVTLGADVAQSTANLLAPVVVNQRNLRAAQVVLTADLPVRAPLLPS
jgi:flagellar assembly factor FliW